MSTNTDYSAPPVHEAVIGVEFVPLPVALVQLARVAPLWEDDFPLVQDAPALPPVVPAAASAPSFSFDLNVGVPPIRFLFASKDQSYLLQVQNDRFVLNWRKMSANSHYPRYAELRRMFDKFFSMFLTFVQEHRFGEVTTRSVEHTYFNRIAGHPISDNILSNFRQPPAQLPGEPHIVRYAEVRKLPTEGDRAVGELSLACDPLFDEGGTMMQLAITTRYFVNDIRADSAALSSPLSRAHEVSKDSFESFITIDKQQEWGRK